MSRLISLVFVRGDLRKIPAKKDFAKSLLADYNPTFGPGYKVDYTPRLLLHWQKKMIPARW